MAGKGRDRDCVDENVLSSLPLKLRNRLMDFQKEGICFAVRKNGRCLIADEMGLGKTLQAISVAYYYRKEWPLLIIVPSSLKFVWIEEIEKWLPDVKPKDIYLIQTGNDASGFAEAKISITTFGLLCKSTSKLLQEALNNRKFQVVIVDESHSIRNIKTASCKAVVPLVKSANRRILLSGTPSLARPVELFPQIDALCPGKFGTWWNYTARYCDAKTEMFGRVRRRCVNGASNLEELAERLSDMLMIRRLKNDVLTQLPPKQRQRVLFQLKDSEIKTEIKKTFEELKPLLTKGKNTADMMNAMQHEGREDHSTNALIQKLYQLSGDAKIGPAREYIEMLCDNENLKFLVFAYHRNMMNGLQQSLYNKKIKFIRIDGETPTSDRQMYVQQFQSDPETKVAILSILAAGVGLTFTAATLVVFAEMYWTPGVMIQCEDRAHRIGQTVCVSIHYLVAKETMDEWVWSAVCKKTIITTTTLNGKKQELAADKGNRYQIEVLSNADAVLPQPTKDVDLAGMFVSQQPKDQMSILDFMTSGKKRKISDQDRNCKRKKTVTTVDDADDLVEETAIVIEDETSEEEEDKSMVEGDKPVVDDDKLTDEEEDDNLSDDCLHDISLHRSRKRENSHNKTSDKKQNIPARKETNDNDYSAKTPTNHLRRLGNSFLNSGSQVEDISITIQNGHEDDDFTPQPWRKTGRKTINERKTVSTTKKHNSGSIRHSKTLRRRLSLPQTNTNPARESDEGSTMMWNCSVCTFINHVDLPYCEMCNELRTKAVDTWEYGRLENNAADSPSAQTKSKDIHSSSGSQVHVSETPGSCGLKNLKSLKSCQCEEETSVMLNSKRKNQSDKCVLKQCEKSSLTNQCEKSSLTNQCKKSSFKQCEKPCLKQHDKPCLQQSDKLVGNNHCDKSSLSILTLTSMTKTLGDHEDVTSKMTSKDGSESDGTQNMDDISSFSSESDNINGDIEDTVCDSDESELDIGSQFDLDFVSEFDLDDTESQCDPNTFNSTNSNVDTSNKKMKDRGEKIEKEKKREKEEGEIEDVIEDMFEDDWEEEVMSQYNSQGKSAEVSCSKTNVRIVDLDMVTIHTHLMYCCSRYTGRVYLFDSEGSSLEANFLPLDIELGNQDALPDLLLHPDNLRLVERFVREWNSLTETKRRLIMKSGIKFTSPLRAYEDLRSGKTHCSQRHISKDDLAIRAITKAQEVKGSTRVISRPEVKGQSLVISDETAAQSRGFVQVVSGDGTPLCLHCCKPYQNKLLEQDSINSTEHAWSTRLCSRSCMDAYWMKTNSQYGRDRLYEVEHGRCQLCDFEAHAFFRQIRDNPDLKQRAELINESKYHVLSARQREQMVRHPAAGQFWHADHIRPVWEGGGECDIDNLRTLCVICHQKVTAEQARKRANIRKLGPATGDITMFFKPLKYSS